MKRWHWQKKEIGEAIKMHLGGLVKSNPELFHKILDIHFLHIKAIAAEDKEMLELFMDYLPFETNKGVRSFQTIRRANPVIYYTSTMDNFKQIRRISLSQGMLVINAAYTFDESLLQKAGRMYRETEIKEITPSGILERFTDVDYTSSVSFRVFEKKSSELLKKYGCIVRLKYFSPEDTPVIFIPGDKNVQEDMLAEDNPLNGLMGSFESKKKNDPVLCMNAGNPIVKTLTGMEDPVVFEAIIYILYVQSLLMGKYPVNNEEMDLFNKSLYKLIVMGVSDLIGNLNK